MKNMQNVSLRHKQILQIDDRSDQISLFFIFIFHEKGTIFIKYFGNVQFGFLYPNIFEEAFVFNKLFHLPKQYER